MPDGITDPNFRPMPGRVGNLTVPQQHALQTLKNQLHDEGHFVEERMDDPMLLRYVPLLDLGVCRCADPLFMSDWSYKACVLTQSADI